MALHKDFIRNRKDTISKNWILTSVLLGLCTALVLYGFSIQFMEAFRILSYYLNDDLIILSSRESLFYKLFYASMSSVIGCSFALKFIFQNSRNYYYLKTRLRQKIIINDQNFTTWHSINWVGKVFFITGAWYVTSPMQYDISFYDDFKLFFILLVIVWFLNLWLNIHGLLGNRTYKWMGIAILLISTNSFFLINLSTIDSEKVNTMLIQNSIEYNYNVNIPSTHSHQVASYSHRLIDLYVGFNKSQNKDSIHILGDYSRRKFDEISLDGVKKYLFQKQDKLNEYERHRASASLHVDSNTRMRVVNLIKQEIQRSGIRYVLLNTKPIYSHYPDHYPPFKNLGFIEWLPNNCDCEIDMIDSLRNLGYESSQIKYPDYYCYRVAFIKDYNRVKITIKNNDQVFLNNSKIEANALGEFLFKFITKYSDNFILLMDVNGESTYGKYIEIKDLMRTVILRIRNSESLYRYDIPYVNSSDTWEQERIWMKEIEKDIPMNIFEFSQSDKYLYDYP